MNPRSTDCEADALTTTPSLRIMQERERKTCKAEEEELRIMQERERKKRQAEEEELRRKRDAEEEEFRLM